MKLIGWLVGWLISSWLNSYLVSTISTCPYLKQISDCPKYCSKFGPSVSASVVHVPQPSKDNCLHLKIMSVALHVQGIRESTCNVLIHGDKDM